MTMIKESMLHNQNGDNKFYIHNEYERRYDMSKIIILRGNSGSGKSTTAKALQREIGRGTLLISQDCIRREMLWVKDGLGNPAIDLLTNLVLYGSKNCDFVILEGILSSEVYENLFKVIKETFDDQIFSYYFDLPFEETLKRHNQKSVSNEFGESQMRRWWKEKDYLKILSEKPIKQEMSLEEIVKLIYNDLTKK